MRRQRQKESDVGRDRDWGRDLQRDRGLFLNLRHNLHSRSFTGGAPWHGYTARKSSRPTFVLKWPMALAMALASTLAALYPIVVAQIPSQSLRPRSPTAHRPPLPTERRPTTTGYRQPKTAEHTPPTAHHLFPMLFHPPCITLPPTLHSSLATAYRPPTLKFHCAQQLMQPSTHT